MQPNVALSAEKVEFYCQQGYLALDMLVDQDEVARLAEIYDRLFRTRAGREVGDQFDLAGPDEEGAQASLPQILAPSKYAPELLQGPLLESALAVARQLLGPEAAFSGDHAIFKPARFGAETPWHQDEAYWGGDQDYQSVSIWIPLQPATLENGCMCFVPGSHRLEVLPHHSIGHDPRIHGLEVDAAETSGAVACPLPAGGATIHHCRTLHYTGPNHSDMPRRAYVLVFGLPATPRDEPRDFYWNRQKHPPREDRARQAAAPPKEGRF